MDFRSRSTGMSDGNAALRGSGRILGWAALGCAACCAAPLIGFLGGASFAAALRPSAEAGAVVIAAGALGVVLVTRRRRSRDSAADGRSGAVCTLPPSDRQRRTEDFRALFDGRLLDRRRDADGVSWVLSASDATDRESRRLAALEERCCDGIRIGIARTLDHVTWRITGPPSAARTLDAFYELPVLVADGVRARELWVRLDGVGCGGKA